jgi:glycerol uptake facilitator protein
LADHIKRHFSYCFGEFFGTFLLVFIGISTVAVSVLFDAPSGQMQGAFMWGMGVTLAIYATRHLSCAHLNPAVSLGMVLAGRMRPKLLLPYWTCQLLGSVVAGGCVLILFYAPIAGYETAHSIVRGSPESVKTAMLFGEYFPNPVFSTPWFKISLPTAMAAEGLGTFILVTMIFLLTDGCNVGRPAETLSPAFIGGTVAVLITVLAPLTQAGINPARDFGPRFIAFLFGWGPIAIPGPREGFLWVYVAAPLSGGAMAAIVFRFFIVPLMSAKKLANGCNCDREV